MALDVAKLGQSLFTDWAGGLVADLETRAAQIGAAGAAADAARRAAAAPAVVVVPPTFGEWARRRFGG